MIEVTGLEPPANTNQLTFNIPDGQGALVQHALHLFTERQSGDPELVSKAFVRMCKCVVAMNRVLNEQ